MVLQLFTKAAEAKLMHTLEDIRERPEGWQAMHFHLSDLLEQYKSEYQIKIAINLIHDLLKGFNGYIFVVSDYSIIVLCYGLDAPLRSKLVFQLRYLYMDDPLAYTDSGQENPDFCTIYNLANDLKDFTDVCSRLMKSTRQQSSPSSVTELEDTLSDELPEASKPEDRIKPPSRPIRRGELSLPVLAMIERDLDHADLNRVIRRQPICAMQENIPPRRVFDELYINIAHLRQMLRAEADFLSDRWLFKYLTHILDQRMIALLRHNPSRYLISPISLNLNVQTLLSPVFAEFDAAIKPAAKVAVIIEVPIVDVFADMAAYNAARTEVQQLGYRICLDGLSTESFTCINREKLGADLVKLQWNADRQSDLENPVNQEVLAAVQATGTNRIILCRCDNKNAIQYGQALGISLFQGRYLDKIVNPKFEGGKLMLTRYFCTGLLLALIVGLVFGQTAGGAVAALLFGFMAGNFACSLVHRLPRGKSMLAHTPYCGSCAHPLSELDLLPVIGALMLKHRCRYCGVSFPTSHTWTELLIGLLFVLAFLHYNFTEQFILAAGIGVFLITLAAIEVNDGIILGKIVLCIAVFGMINRTLVDSTLYNFFSGGLTGLVLGALLWRKQIKPLGHIYTLPKPAELMALGGICVGLNDMPWFLALFAVFYGIDWIMRKILRTQKPPIITVTFGLAVILLVLYPNILSP